MWGRCWKQLHSHLFLYISPDARCKSSDVSDVTWRLLSVCAFSCRCIEAPAFVCSSTRIARHFPLDSPRDSVSRRALWTAAAENKQLHPHLGVHAHSGTNSSAKQLKTSFKQKMTTAGFEWLLCAQIYNKRAGLSTRTQQNPNMIRI